MSSSARDTWERPRGTGKLSLNVDDRLQINSWHTSFPRCIIITASRSCSILLQFLDKGIGAGSGLCSHLLQGCCAVGSPSQGHAPRTRLGGTAYSSTNWYWPGPASPGWPLAWNRDVLGTNGGVIWIHRDQISLGVAYPSSARGQILYYCEVPKAGLLDTCIE